MGLKKLFFIVTILIVSKILNIHGMDSPSAEIFLPYSLNSYSGDSKKFSLDHFTHGIVSGRIPKDIAIKILKATIRRDLNFMEIFNRINSTFGFTKSELEDLESNSKTTILRRLIKRGNLDDLKILINLMQALDIDVPHILNRYRNGFKPVLIEVIDTKRGNPDQKRIDMIRFLLEKGADRTKAAEVGDETRYGSSATLQKIRSPLGLAKNRKNRFYELDMRNIHSKEEPTKYLWQVEDDIIKLLREAKAKEKHNH